MTSECPSGFSLLVCLSARNLSNFVARGFGSCVRECVCEYMSIYIYIYIDVYMYIYIQHWLYVNTRRMLYARAIPSGPKLSSEHAARERECPACKPRLRPPTFLHNTRTLPPSLPKRPPATKHPFSPFLPLRPRPVPNPFPATATPDLPLRGSATFTLSLPLSSSLVILISSIIPDFCGLTDIQTGALSLSQFAYTLSQPSIG